MLTSPLSAIPTAEPLLPDHLSALLWRGNTLRPAPPRVVPSSHPRLDDELPGGGWPRQAVVEILQPPGVWLEWRLLSPALRWVMQAGGTVLLIGPPHRPHLPGLCQQGLRADQLVWVESGTPAESLWATEQALKSGAFTAVLGWLPTVRPAQIRRLQACASTHPGLAFMMRPLAVRAESSAAPLRVAVWPDPVHAHVRLELIKRRGPALDVVLDLSTSSSGQADQGWPAGVAPLLPPGWTHPQAPAAPHTTPTPPSPRAAPQGAPARLRPSPALTSPTRQELAHAALDRPAGG